uniref:Uncharacterized protein n=1 Tax=Anguilla anguilla TaxID=7936 RepID=A0A0E9RL28_ANGAN
MYSLLKKEPQK